MTPDRVLCNATVDPGETMLCRMSGAVRSWLVTVEGIPPHDQTRIYRIEANTDSKAAMEGIRRFVVEMEQT